VPLPAFVHELPSVAAKFRPARCGLRRQANPAITRLPRAGKD